MIDASSFEELLGPELGGALAKKGFTELTPVQAAVLEPEHQGVDLRISSQTGSGKTVAIGLTLRNLVAGDTRAEKGIARPRALVVVPTRELAKQVEEELRWLYEGLRVRVASVTGGGGYRDELRAFSQGPGVIVGTPGRLLDHLDRGAIAPSQIAAIVLDEADRMLDLGFQEDIEKIFSFAPEGRRTHLVSATFPREVLRLADRVQNAPVRVEGTPLGSANADIEHLVHLVASGEQLSAIINLLLASPSGQTLIFARTRADVADLTSALADAGFRVRSLSGEMEQRERNAALADFKRGDLHALVATDVAARGIDVQDIARVIHAEAPTDADSYTHRSGRTGRAGKKGASSLLVTPAGLARAAGLLRRARVQFRLAPVPTREEILAGRDERIFEKLTGEEEIEPRPDDAAWTLAKRLAAAPKLTQVLARLLALSKIDAPAEPRRVTVVRSRPIPEDRPRRERDRDREWDRDRPRAPGPEGARPGPAARGGDERPPREPRGPREPRPAKDRAPGAEGAWVPFRVTWGELHGADTRRLLAMMCRRGQIDGVDVGAIRVFRTYSVVNIAESAAPGFESATRAPDPRDPRVRIQRFIEGGPPPRDREGGPHERIIPPAPSSKPQIPLERRSGPELGVVSERPPRPHFAGGHGKPRRPKR